MLYSGKRKEKKMHTEIRASLALGNFKMKPLPVEAGAFFFARATGAIPSAVAPKK